MTVVLGLALTCASAADPPDLTHLRGWYGGLASPARLAVDLDDNVYVTDSARHQVVVRAPTGEVIRRFTVRGRPVGVAVAEDGIVFVSDSDGRSVRGYDADGDAVIALGQGDGEFGLATDLAVDGATGEVWVADGARGRIAVYTADGTLQWWFDGSPDEALAFPSGLWLTDTVAWVADQKGRRLRRFDLSGAEIASFGEHGDRDGEVYMPAGLWADGAGRVFVADTRLARVIAFDEDGTWLGTVGAYGTGPGQLRLPSDVVGDRYGRLLVASGNNGRIDMWGIDDYSDPEQYLVAEVEVSPLTLVRDAAPDFVSLRVEIEGTRPSDVRDLAANGVPALEVVIGDADRDRIRDLTATIDTEDLLDTLPWDGAGTIRVTATAGGLAVDIDVDVTIVGEDVGDTGDDDTASDTGDTADTGDWSDPPDGCRCTAADGAAAFALPLLVFAVLLRRRP